MRPADDAFATAHAQARLLAPGDLPALLSRLAHERGAVTCVVHLAGYAQDVLAPLPGRGVPHRLPQQVDGTLAGRCFTTLEVQVAHDEHGPRLWVPLVDGIARLGVVEVLLPPGAPVDVDAQAAWTSFSDVVAPLVLTKDAYGDAFTLARRTESMSLAAEVQWGLLPPLTFGTEQVLVSAVLEPAYDIGGDTFDYAVNGDTVHVAVLDAMGHGLRASILASLALAAYRHARRRGLTLQESAAAVDAAVAAEHAGERFVTGLLAQLHVPTGRLRTVACGHPAPLLVRDAHLVRRDDPPPALPLGLMGLAGSPAAPPVVEESLQPGDRVVLFTDGVVEARGTDRVEFGVERLVEALTREAASGLALPEVLRRLVRRLLEHQPSLEDDATMLVLEWGGAAGSAMLPVPRPASG